MKESTKGILAYVILCFGVILFCFLAWVFRDTEPRIESTWPDSAEFSQIESGADRFSEHATNLEGVIVLVDHATGIQYAMTAGGVTPLLEADGTPMTVLEVGE